MSEEFKHHEGHDRHLCARVAFRINDIFIDIVKNAKYICKRCGRVATSEDYLCYPKTLE